MRAIVNLALARGWVGREGCGLMPIRGHSGVQGGAEMGCYATALPGGLEVSPDNAAALGEQWGFDVPAGPGRTAPEMIDAAHAGELDVLISVGGNFLEVLPDPAHVREALASVPLRVHYDIVLSSQMLVDPAETVLLLPATTRYEVPGGITETSTERRVILSPEVEGPRVERGAAGVGGAAGARPPRPARPRGRAHVCGRYGPGARGDRPGGAALRRHREAARTGATASSTADRSIPPDRTSPPRTAGRASRRSRRRRRARPTACSRCPPAAASSSTRWCRSARTRSPARVATP